MKGHLLRLGKQTMIYGIGGVALQAIGVLTLPIYTRVFSQAEYGVIEVVVVSMGVAALLVDAGFATALQRSYFDYTDDQPDPRATVLFTAIATSLAIGLVVAFTVAVLHEQIARWLFGETRYAGAVLIAAAALPVTGLASLTRQVLRLRFQPWRYMTSALIAALGGSGVALTAVLVLDRGVEGVFFGTLVGALLSVAYNAVTGWAAIGRTFSRPELRTMLAFGLPLLPAALSLWVLQFLDRIMLSKLGTLSDVGQYAVANRIAMPLLLLVTAFATAYAPFLLSLFSTDAGAEKQLRGRMLGYVVGGLTVAGVALSLCSRELLAVLAPGFEDAYLAVWLIVIGTVAFGATAVTTAGFTLARRTKYMATYSGLAAAVNVGLNFILIPLWGMPGAAASTAIAYLVLSTVYYLRAQDVYPTPYEPRKAVGIGALGVLVLPLSLLDAPSLWMDVGARVGAFGVLVLGLFASGIVSREELRALRDSLRRGGDTKLAEA